MVNTLACLAKGTGFNFQLGKKFSTTKVYSVWCGSFHESEHVGNQEEDNGKPPPIVVPGK